jgi:endonuclease YncB( thermonuclease family)
MGRKYVPLLLLILATPLPASKAGELSHLNGKVVAVADGDTITVLDAQHRQHKVRIDGIDSPESGQAFGNNAKQSLSQKIFGKTVRVTWESQDRYGRILGDVYLGERDIGREMVKEGFAWHFKKYNSESELAKAEAEARRSKAGLWRDKDPIAPWSFRSRAADRIDVPSGSLGQTRVYVTSTGTKYHSDGCRFLAKSKTATTLEKVRETHQPCGVCKPPR